MPEADTEALKWLRTSLSGGRLLGQVYLREAARDRKELGNVASKKHRSKEAVDHYSAAISFAGEDAGILNALYSNRSASHLALEQVAEAIADAERCISVDPHWGKSHYRLGKALEQAGESKKALDAFNADL